MQNDLHIKHVCRPAVKRWPIYIPLVLEKCVPSLAHIRECFTFGSPFKKMNSFVSLKHHKAEWCEGEEGRVPRHILKRQNTSFLHDLNLKQAYSKLEKTSWRKQSCFECLPSINSAEVLEKPCMDGDQHHMSPASGLLAGNFAPMFQVSVHWEEEESNSTPNICVSPP